ncbi:DUF2147 domain-containing protein [Sphingobium sp. Sx8-8]|uniref:DUF2147 domain-containing protein n=1 Tax=Sphingobium sp. Sx8-8 TaxID=2933617 RepID=UPI001F578B78|nr:DUF2147 domain-containing protein [Sphingobium sp. Sx8-8]
MPSPRSRPSRRAMIVMIVAMALLAAAALFLPITGAQRSAPDAIAGVWSADDGSSNLDFMRAAGGYQARIVYGRKLMEPDGVSFKRDALNPDPALRSRSMKNVVIVTGLRYDNGIWTGGSIYDATSGRTFRCMLWMKNGALYLRGYFGLPLLGETRSFHRLAA